MFSLTGIIKQKAETRQVSEKFKTREFVITDQSSQYHQHITFQLSQYKCALIDSYKVGD
jgi:single-strand DNA-binding protein